MFQVFAACVGRACTPVNHPHDTVTLTHWGPTLTGAALAVIALALWWELRRKQDMEWEITFTREEDE